MSLQNRQIQQFKTQGYLAVESFFSAREVAALQADLARLRRVGAFRNVATDGDGKTNSQQKENLQICPLYPKSELVRALPFHPQITDYVSKLIGDPLVLHLDQVFLKPARHGAGTNWHQDNAYFKIPDALMGTAMWIAIHDATIVNGTINVIPGLQHEPLEHSRDPMSNHHIRCYPDESKSVPIELKAGGVAFFCYGTPHCTRANNSDKDRAGLAIHFMNEKVYNPENKSGAIGTYLNGPRTTGGLNEYGVKVAGTWEVQVEAALRQEEFAGAK